MQYDTNDVNHATVYLMSTALLRVKWAQEQGPARERLITWRKTGIKVSTENNKNCTLTWTRSSVWRNCNVVKKHGNSCKSHTTCWNKTTIFAQNCDRQCKILRAYKFPFAAFYPMTLLCLKMNFLFQEAPSRIPLREDELVVPGITTSSLHNFYYMSNCGG